MRGEREQLNAGQAAVEYVLAASVTLAIVLALGALWSEWHSHGPVSQPLETPAPYTPTDVGQGSSWADDALAH